MKDIFFIGTIVPESLLQSVEKISYASINYQKKVIKAFKFDQIFCLVPLNIPSQKKKFFVEDGIVYIHNKFFGSRIFKLVFDQIAAYSRIRKASTVVFYNITIQNFILIYLLSRFKKCYCFSIVADYEDYKNYTGIKRFVQKIINSSFNLLKGAIVLNPNIKIPTKSVVLEGIIDPQDFKPFTKEIIKNRILFSGSVGYTTGIHVAIQAMDYLPDFELIITGPSFDLEKKDIDDLILKGTNNNVTYLGSLNKEKYQDLLCTCNIALSLRDISKPEHQHNFPSKILEYLSYNKKVISTINYECVSDYLTVCEFDPVSIAGAIQNISLTDSFNSKDFVVSKFGLVKFSEALEQLVKDTRHDV